MGAERFAGGVPGRGGARRGEERQGQRRERPPLGTVEPIPQGTITALSERRAGSARYVVQIDGRQAAVVSAQGIAELGLRTGLLVDETLSERLREASGELAVFDKAVELLAVRARSTRDLRMRLRRAGAAEAQVERAVQRLTALSLLNDEEYARNLAHMRVVGGGVSKRRIGQELQKRGVPRDVADEAIDATLEEVELDEQGAALTAARRRIRVLGSLDEQTRRRRLYAFLARRGYSPDVIARAVRDVLAGRDDEGPGPGDEG